LQVKQTVASWVNIISTKKHGRNLSSMFSDNIMAECLFVILMLVLLREGWSKIHKITLWSVFQHVHPTCMVWTVGKRAATVYLVCVTMRQGSVRKAARLDTRGLTVEEVSMVS